MRSFDHSSHQVVSKMDGQNIHVGPAAVLPTVGSCLFWCFDQCAKIQNHQVREELSNFATEAGLEFRWEKNSIGFLSWLQDASGTSGRTGIVLLLADWRQAKAIQQELSKRSESCQHVVRICVVAPAERNFRRASAWAGQQEAGSNIVVVSGSWLKGAQELANGKQKTASPRYAAAEMPVYTPVASDHMLGGLSLVSLMKAVRDPRQAAELEHLIQQTMWQLYDD